MAGAEPPEEPAEEGKTLERLLLSDSVQQAITEIPQLIRDNMNVQLTIAKMQLDVQGAAAARATTWIVALTLGLAVIVVGPAAFLTWDGKLSADAATFLFGAIVGAAFTFLRAFFPRAG